jgi:hypothetical protein
MRQTVGKLQKTSLDAVSPKRHLRKSDIDKPVRGGVYQT